MKRIVIVETSPNGLKTAKAYLAESNAEFDVLPSVGEVLALPGKPDLIILLANRDVARYRQDIEVLRKSAVSGNGNRISVLPVELSGPGNPASVVEGEIEFSMPLPKLEFLSAVAKSLGIPPRRSFRILVTLQPEKSNLKYSAMSIDFSESGMAFECTEDFEKGQMLFIAFVNPKTRNRFLLRAEIARRVEKQGGKNVFYGVRFVGLTRQERDDLYRFITSSE